MIFFLHIILSNWLNIYQSEIMQQVLRLAYSQWKYNEVEISVMLQWLLSAPYIFLLNVSNCMYPLLK